MITQDNRFIISGELNFETIMPIWKSSLALLTTYSTLYSDLSPITGTNSAGLILLIEWLKYAKYNNKTILFEKIPQQLQSIARVVGLKIPEAP